MLATAGYMPIEGGLRSGPFLGHMEGKFSRQDLKRAPASAFETELGVQAPVWLLGPTQAGPGRR
eukprot:5119920-Heterocapsa_arctica.AAC.1